MLFEYIVLDSDLKFFANFRPSASNFISFSHSRSEQLWKPKYVPSKNKLARTSLRKAAK